MNILTVHNYYQIPGGEEQTFQAESDLLELKGHQVHRYAFHNDDIPAMAPWALAGKTLWNRSVYQELRSLIQKHRIELVHFHNTFPLISPAAYYAVKAEGIPVVQTCHNYRLLCPSALFLRDKQVCESCLGKAVPWPGVWHGCYRDSRAASAVTAAMLTLHRALGTWVNQVDCYIALTEFARHKFIQGGIPAEKIMLKPNFLYPTPQPGQGQGGYALFVGRLSVEKGIDLLLQAWQRLGNQMPLRIIGDGPLAATVAEAATQNSAITWLGRQPSEVVYEQLKEATCLVFPSQWYEGLPRIIIESFAVGTPVIAADLGSMSSLIQPQTTGLHFCSGQVEDLVSQVEWALQHPEEVQKMRRSARQEFEVKYTAEINYRQLMEIYQTVLPNGQNPNLPRSSASATTNDLGDAGRLIQK